MALTKIPGSLIDSGDNLTITDLTVTGNLSVTGTSTSLETATLQVEDKNIVLNYGSGDTSASADGAGITIQNAIDATADATFNWGASNDRFKLSHGLEVLTGNVGIGTTSPSAKTHIYDASTDAVLYLDSGNANGSHARFLASGSVKHFVGSSGGFSLGDVDDFGIRSFDNILFATGNSSTERMRIDSSGNVGIGTTSPSSFFSDARQLVVGSGSGSQGITINSGTSENGQIFFADGTSGDAAYRGIMRYLHASDAMAFYTAGANERMRIDSSGNLFLNTTSAMDNCFVSLQDHSNGEAFLGLSSKDDNNVGIRFGVGTDRKWVNFRDTSDNLIWYSNAAGAERMRISSGGELQIPGHSGYELGFTGNQTINVRSDAGMFMLANTVHSDPYFGLGIGPSAWGQHLMMRTKTSTGTDGSATTYNAVSVGTTAGGSSLGSYNGPEPMAPFHVLKGGLTMNGFNPQGVTAYAHSNSDSGQWMHMNSAGRSGSGVGNFQLYIPTAQTGQSWGGFGGDLFLSGYNGQHEYIIWRGYTNSGLAGASASVVSGTGSPTITVGQNGAFGFYINVSNIGMTHPIAMYRVCKGGNPGREWDLSEISCRWY